LIFAANSSSAAVAGMHTERNEKDELQHIDNGSILAKDAHAVLLQKVNQLHL